MNRRRTVRWLLLVVMLAALGLLAPAWALGAAKIAEIHADGLADVDARSGTVAPTAQQLQIVSSLGATARWNDFGTPQSLIKHGGYLATRLNAASASAAALSWIDANRALFRLGSTATLRPYNDSRLAQSDGHAVVFRQEFGGLAAGTDGLITVGVTGTPASGWRIAYVSSSLTGDTSLAGQPQLSPVEAWLLAATNVGRSFSIVNVSNSHSQDGWTVFDVAGLAQLQRARLVAVPTPAGGVVPAYETYFVDGSAGTSAYRHFVDARNGDVLIRNDLVEHITGPTPFNGSLPATDGGCGPLHGPYNAPANTISIDVQASATIPANDIVLKLFFGTTLVQAADTATSPEVIHYEPAAGVPPGNYYVQVCEFQDGTPPISPTSYSGTITINDAASTTPIPYPPKWRVFPANPLLGSLAQYPWGIPSTDARKKWCWVTSINGSPVSGCDMALANLASRVPWDHDVQTDLPTYTTRGNNAYSAEAWTSPLTPGGTNFHPVSAQRNYDFPWTNAWYGNPPPPNSCSESNLVPFTGNDISAAIVNLFGMHNRMHDWSYFLGFTEENWNAQEYNFGLTSKTRQGDSVLGDAQAGALNGGFPSYLGRDNANMIPLPDGVHPITNMYLWQPLRGAFYAPCVDGDYDMAVIGHEYTHLIENRMIGKGGTRTGHHAGAMGESYSDLNAVEYLNEYNFVPVSGENPFAVGAYVTGNKLRAIRNYGMNFPRTGAFPTPGVYPLVDPLNFSNMGYDLTGPQVHADGEIWSATNYDIRQALVSKYDGAFPSSNATLQKQCADGVQPPQNCPGNRRWIQIMYDAFLLMPVGPSMLDSRDAYLAADMMRFGGANQSELWLSFARRGFGPGAFSSNTAADTDTDPKPDFSSPLQSGATVTFNAVASSEGNTPITNARIYVGHYQARTSPIADTNPTTNTGPPGANNLDSVATFAPGTYEFVANAPGYGHVRFSQTFTAGTTPTVTISFPTNWASMTKGATATGDGTRFSDLIDDTESTNWERTGPVAGSQVTVDLAGTAPRTVNRVQVSAMLLPGQNRFTALRKFRIEVSTNGVTFTPVLTSADNAFPGANPRPVAPELLLRSFSFPAVAATHVRIVVLTNQCTGNTQFQGEQDNDPANYTDCRTSVAAPPGSLAPRDTDVRIAELQVFSSAGGGNGGPPPPPPPAPPPPPPPPGSCTEDDDIVLSGAPTASVGGNVGYTVTYTNLGSVEDVECEIEDKLPDDLTYVSSSNGGSYDAASRTVRWNLANIPAGGSRSVTLTGRISSSAAIGSVLIDQAYFGALGLGLSPLASAGTLVLP